MTSDERRQKRRDAENRRREARGLPPVGSWGGHRPKGEKAASGPPKTAAQPRKANDGIDLRALGLMLPEILALSERYSKKVQRTAENNPYDPARWANFHPPASTPKDRPSLAMDNALVGGADFAGAAWGNGGLLDSFGAQGLIFPGYPYLAELAIRTEYRIISETIADDATRKWIDFDVVGDEADNKRKQKNDPVGFAEMMADPDQRKKRIKEADKTDKIKAIKDDQDRLKAQDAFYAFSRDDGFFGRSHLYFNFGISDPTDPELASPIGDGRDAASKGKVRKGSKLQEIKPIEAVWVNPLQYNAYNPLAPGWYKPLVWYVMGGTIHSTRLLTGISHPVPDLFKAAYSFGGISNSQLAEPYVNIWLQTRQSIADLIHSFSVMVLSTDLQTILQPGQADGLLARIALFNALRDNQGSFVINKNTEEFQNVSASLTGLHELQAQALEHICSATRIPLVKYTGISPSGLNATSEFEIEVYDDTIAAYQGRFMRTPLETLINFQQLYLFGEIDPQITWRFERLREMTDIELAEKQKNDAARDESLFNVGAIGGADVRKRISEDPDMPYMGIDPDDLPDVGEEVQEGLVVPGGGRAVSEEIQEEGGTQKKPESVE